MRRLPLPATDDEEALRDLVALRTQAAVAIRPLAGLVSARYQQYRASRGNPWQIDRDESFDTIGKLFHSTYKRERPPFEFIATLRTQNDGACPICGGAGTGTLDHYLPKANFPEFSFFSPNLVPACFNCNVKRRTRYKGDVQDQRPIHPYYDQLPDICLLHVEIRPPFAAPGFSATARNAPPQLQDALRWHIDNVIVPAGFLKHCQQRWAQLVKRPRLYIGPSVAVDAARQELQRRADEASHLSASLNSWDGCLLEGVAQSEAAVEHLLATALLLDT